MLNRVEMIKRTIVLLSLIVSVIADDVTPKDSQEIENELYNQSSVYLKEMEDIFKNESKVLFKEHIENFRLEMDNEIHNIEKFIIQEYDTMINALNRSEGATNANSSVVDKLVEAREHAIQSYRQIRDKLHNVVENIDSNIESHKFGVRAFEYVKRAFHKIAVLVNLSKKDPISSGEAADQDGQQKEQQQILQQMPLVNYFPQLSNIGL